MVWSNLEAKFGCSLAQEFDAGDITGARKEEIQGRTSKISIQFGAILLDISPAGYELEELRPIHKTPVSQAHYTHRLACCHLPLEWACFDFVLEIFYLVLRGSPLLLKLKASPDCFWTSCREMREQELPTWANFKTPGSSCLQIANLPKANSFRLPSLKPRRQIAFQRHELRAKRTKSWVAGMHLHILSCAVFLTSEADPVLLWHFLAVSFSPGSYTG